MSDFFISGFTDSGVTPLSAVSQPGMPSAADWRRMELAQSAYVALAKFEFGAVDIAHGRATGAARDLMDARRRAGQLSHPRARQRATAYYPLEGREHCPHCWVFTGDKHRLVFALAERVETASCGQCGSQFQLARAAAP